MKKIFLATMAFAAFTFAASAQEAPAGGGRGNRPGMEGRMGGNDEQMIKDLNLTPAQAEQWKKVSEDRKAQMAALRNDTNLSREEKGEKMKAIMDDNKTKTDAILTPEQRTTRDAMRKKMMEERGNRTGQDSSRTYDNTNRKTDRE